MTKPIRLTGSDADLAAAGARIVAEQQRRRDEAANQLELTEHRRAAARTLGAAQVEAIAASLHEGLIARATPAPVVRETTEQARVRRLAEAAAVEPDIAPHELGPEDFKAEVARRFAAAYRDLGSPFFADTRD